MSKLLTQVCGVMDSISFLAFRRDLNSERMLREYIHIYKSTQCILIGNVSNAERYNQLVDLFMRPTNYEGLPMVIIEAMRYGKPIVASNVGGISEIVVDDENGYTVENASSAFAEKIQYIFENESIEAVPKLQLLEQALFIRSFPKMRTDDFENV